MKMAVPGDQTLAGPLNNIKIFQDFKVTMTLIYPNKFYGKTNKYNKTTIQNNCLRPGLDVEVPSHLMRPILFDGNVFVPILDKIQEGLEFVANVKMIS